MIKPNHHTTKPPVNMNDNTLQIMEKKGFGISEGNMNRKVIDYLNDTVDTEKEGKMPVKHFIIDLKPADMQCRL